MWKISDRDTWSAEVEFVVVSVAVPLQCCHRRVSREAIIRMLVLAE